MVFYNKLAFQRTLDQLFGGALCLLAYPFKIFKKRNNSDPKSITIVKLTGLGDAILVLPLIKEIKDKKNVHIRVITGKESAQIFSGLKFIDNVEILKVENKNIFSLIPQLFRLVKQKTDIGIDTTHSSFFSTFLNFITSRKTIGFKSKNSKIRQKLLDEKVEFDSNLHIVHNNLNLSKPLGLNFRSNKINLISPNYSETEKKKALSLVSSKSLIGLHPFSTAKNRAWPYNNFSEVIQFVLENYNHDVVLVGSPSEIKESEKLLRFVPENHKKRVINLVGKTSIHEFMALAEKFKLFIANDGGLMHLAAAMQTPTLGIFLYESPSRYRPFNNKSDSVHGDPKFWADVNKTPSWKIKYSPECLKTLKTKSVISKIKEML